MEILNIDDINYRNQEELSKELSAKSDELSEVMRLNSEIEFDYEDGKHLLSTSKDSVFYHATTMSLRQYFNNAMMNFTVYEPQRLEIVQDEPVSSFGIVSSFVYNTINTICDFINFVGVTFWTLNGILFVCGVIGLAAMAQNNCSKKIDSANWLAIILYGVVCTVHCYFCSFCVHTQSVLYSKFMISYRI